LGSDVEDWVQNWCNQYGGDTCAEGGGELAQHPGQPVPDDKFKVGESVTYKGDSKWKVERFRPGGVLVKHENGTKKWVSPNSIVGEQKQPAEEKEPEEKGGNPITALKPNASVDERLKAFTSFIDQTQPVGLKPEEQKRLEELGKKIKSRSVKAKDKVALMDEYARLSSQQETRHWQNNKEEARAIAREAFVRAFKTDTPADATFEAGVPSFRDGAPYKPTEPLQIAAMDNAKGFVTSLLGQHPDDGTIPFKFYKEHGNNRAHAADNYINVGNYTQNAAVLVHEMGHVIEREKGLADEVNAFLSARVGNEPLKPIAGLPGEHGRDDKFDAAFGASARYVGKTYPDGATEVVSMTLQKMYENPAHLARTDPELMKFVIGIVRDSKSRVQTARLA